MIRFSSVKANILNIATDLLVTIASKNELEKNKKGGKVSPYSFSSLDARFDGSLTKALQRASFKGKGGSSFHFTLQDESIASLLVVVAPESKGDAFDSHAFFRKLGALLSQHAKKVGARRAVLAPGALRFESETHIAAFIEGVELSAYKFTRYKSEKESGVNLAEVAIASDRPLSQRAIDSAQALCTATVLARDLVNMPPNDCTPTYLVETAKDIAKKGQLQIKVFEKKDLVRMGAHSLLSVSKGTVLPPYLIKLTYAPKKRAKKTKVVSLVGKGITFDTGGYSLKPGDSMIGMGGDMAGAAAVLGAMQFVAATKPACEVRGYIPTTENMISGEATRVGDIVKAMNGKTIEILNTDAEGRLILADALTMASNDKADVIIDLATLTGACLVALGAEYAGLFTDDDRLARDIVDCGAVEGERYWRLPLAPEYKDSIKSKIADLKNIGSNRYGGAIIGGLFLQHFVSGSRWAHLDIAGPADSSADKDHLTAGGVGFGVRTLARYIQRQ